MSARKGVSESQNMRWGNILRDLGGTTRNDKNRDVGLVKIWHLGKTQLEWQEDGGIDYGARFLSARLRSGHGFTRPALCHRFV